MLRTSLRDKTSSQVADDPELVDGATDLIEAATAEAAIAEVHERLGPDARILEARRDLRGGIGGFFAKEVVRLHVAPGPGRADVLPGDGVSLAGPEEQPAADEDRSVRSPVERLLDDAPDTIDFATFLRERMESDPGLQVGVPDDRAAAIEHGLPDDDVRQADTEHGPSLDEGSSIVEDDAVAAWRAAARRPLAPVNNPDTTVPSEPAPDPRAEVAATSVAAGDPVPGPAWSRERLLHLGIPADLVRGLDLDQDADDLAWTTALAHELADACGPLPSGPALLVGPLADDLKGRVGEPTARSQVWFDALRDGRWLHLVVGGEGWRDHLSAEPRVVSWTRPGDLPDAVRCARELGLTLGYGPVASEIRRARPLDVAIGIRELVDGR